MGARQILGSGRAASAWLALSLVSGCTSDPGGITEPPQGLSIQLAPANSGEQQTATVGSTLPEPLRVLVRRGAEPASGIEVSWSATQGHLTASKTTTDASGIATVAWTLGTVAGRQSAGAGIPPDTFPTVAFGAVASPGPATRLVWAVGPTTAFVGRPFHRVLEVDAVDAFGNTATAFGGTVTVTLDPSGSLVGTASATATFGVATFPDLSIAQAGTGYTLTASTTALLPVTTTTFDIVAPISGRIAFRSDRDGTSGIYSMNTDGSGVVRLTTGGEPAWSPDGSTIAFVTGVTGNGIYTMNFDGSAVTAVVTGGGVLFPRAPAWSPDGSKLAGYVPGAIRARPPRILVVNPDGSGRLDLTPPGAYPAWSPDGRIGFRCAGSPGPGICVMNSDGSLLTLLRNDSYSSEPAWAPDGTKIAFVRAGAGTSEVWVMNADGGGVIQLTHDQASVARPAWSPDGARIAFASTRDGNWEIYVMNADGSGATRLTDNAATDTWPSWSP